MITSRFFLFATLLVLMLSQHSCTPTRGDAEAEFSDSNEEEGGASANDNDSKPGVRAEVAMVAKSSHAGSNSNSADRDENYSGNYSANYAAAMDNGGIAFRTALAFAQKGSQFQGTKVTLNYLELTEDIYFEHKFSNNGSLFGGIGPYMAYGIGGKASGGGFSAKAFGGTDGYKRFDAGLNIMGGYRLASGLFFHAGYDFGLVNKSPAPDFTSKNRSFMLGVGYSFDLSDRGGKKK
jgi:hypothetical protein